jgi:hypothetical protein
MVEFLLRRGAKLSPPDDPPWATPLAWARRRGHRETSTILEHFEETGKVPPRPLETYENLANDFMQAYNSGDADSLQRIARHFERDRPISAADFRNFLRAHLDKAEAEENGDEGLSIGDALLMVGRMHGFKSWAELASA